MSLAPDDHRHGTVNGYGNLGCRCGRCTDAHAANYAEQRARKARERTCPNCEGPGGQMADGECTTCYQYRLKHGHPRDPDALNKRHAEIEARRDKAEAMARDLAATAEIEAALGVDRRVVSSDLRSRGITVDMRRQWRRDEAARLRYEGWTVPQIADRFDVGWDQANKWVRAADLSRTTLLAERRELVAQLRAEGLGTCEIARRIGVDRSTILHDTKVIDGTCTEHAYHGHERQAVDA